MTEIQRSSSTSGTVVELCTPANRRAQLEAEKQLIFNEMDARDRRLDEIRDELAGLPE